MQALTIGLRMPDKAAVWLHAATVYADGICPLNPGTRHLAAVCHAAGGHALEMRSRALRQGSKSAENGRKNAPRSAE